MNLSEDELDQVAGGKKWNRRVVGGKPERGRCAYVGVGFGRTDRKGNTAIGFLIGGSDGPLAGGSE